MTQLIKRLKLLKTNSSNNTVNYQQPRTGKTKGHIFRKLKSIH